MSDATTATVPSLTAVLKATVANYMTGVFSGWMPGRIQSLTANKRKATIELLIQDVEETRLGRTVKPFPIINEVPILMPGRAGAFIEWTPQTGDTVVVLFCARSVDRYLQTGGLVDPDDVRMHDINDAIALPVASFDFAHVASADPQIKFTGTEIQAGGSAALAFKQDVADLKSALDTFMTSLASAISGIPTGGTAAGTLITTAKGVFDTFLASKLGGTSKLKGG